MKEHPEIAFYLLDIGDKSICIARPYVYESKKVYKAEYPVQGISTSVTFSTDCRLVITGVGVSWVPTNDVNVQVDIITGHEIIYTHYSNFNDIKIFGSIMQIYFKKPVITS